MRISFGIHISTFIHHLCLTRETLLNNIIMVIFINGGISKYHHYTLKIKMDNLELMGNDVICSTT